jgi:regulator of protease activity HflC (stomatin/prohibitin superfamily)
MLLSIHMCILCPCISSYCSGERAHVSGRDDEALAGEARGGATSGGARPEELSAAAERAERERRAEVTLATAERESKVLISEGIRQESINLSEGERQRWINLAKGKAREIQLIAEATAAGVQMVAQATMQPGGKQAMKMRLSEQFIGRLSQILSDSKVAIYPAEFAQLKSVLEAMRSSLGSEGSSAAGVTNAVSQKGQV